MRTARRYFHVAYLNILVVINYWLYYYGDHIKEIGGGCSTHGRDEKYKILVGKPRRIWEDNIRMILGTYGGQVDTGFIWLRGSGQGHVAGSWEHGNDPSGSTKAGNS
jgi:hypothetical protein